jgi:hypothetical protein
MELTMVNSRSVPTIMQDHSQNIPFTPGSQIADLHQGFPSDWPFTNLGFLGGDMDEDTRALLDIILQPHLDVGAAMPLQ